MPKVWRTVQYLGVDQRGLYTDQNSSSDNTIKRGSQYDNFPYTSSSSFPIEPFCLSKTVSECDIRLFRYKFLRIANKETPKTQSFRSLAQCGPHCTGRFRSSVLIFNRSLQKSYRSPPIILSSGSDGDAGASVCEELVLVEVFPGY
jgi:hypothetical protein